jgi:hypothetical protein
MKNGTLLRQVINNIDDCVDLNDSKNRHPQAVDPRERATVRSELHRITETLEVL